MSPKKMFFFIRQNLSFSSLIDEKRKKRRLMKREKKWSKRCSRRIDPVPSFFFQFFGKKSFTSSWLHRRLMVVKFSNFCIVFFIFQRVQSLRDSREIDGLHVDRYLSNIRRLVIDNPILLRWDIKYVFSSLRPQY